MRVKLAKSVSFDFIRQLNMEANKVTPMLNKLFTASGLASVLEEHENEDELRKAIIEQ